MLCTTYVCDRFQGKSSFATQMPGLKLYNGGLFSESFFCYLQNSFSVKKDRCKPMTDNIELEQIARSTYLMIYTIFSCHPSYPLSNPYFSFHFFQLPTLFCLDFVTCYGPSLRLKINPANGQ